MEITNTSYDSDNIGHVVVFERRAKNKMKLFL